MFRNSFSVLEYWKIKNMRKPLILLGARQVGKIYALQNLGKTSFERTAYLNFEETPSAKFLFEKDLSPKRILKELSVFLNMPIEPGKTVLIMDEIQEAPQLLTSLKYFCENMPDLQRRTNTSYFPRLRTLENHASRSALRASKSVSVGSNLS